MKMIHMGNWGVEHWRLLRIVEEQCVHHGGTLDRSAMRCNQERHPEMWSELGISDDIPIRLRDGTLQEHHDDWDMIKDFAVHDLVKTTREGEVKLTKEGWDLAHSLRRHLANDGYYTDFAEKKVSPDAGLYVVRQYDRHDHEWIDVSKPVPKEAADADLSERTEGGTIHASYGEGHYFKIFPASTRMAFDGR
jgi:hypothetical protein